MDLLDLFCEEGLGLTGPMPLELLEQTVELMTDKKRYPHVFGCRVTAAALAQFWGADPMLATRAALLHDITKALSYEEHLKICSHFGVAAEAWQEKTIHALTGSIVAGEVFKEQSEVCVAIRRHTTGETGMSLLDEIIYVADYIEPSRETPGVEQVRRAAFEDMNTATMNALRKTLSHLKEQGREIADSSIKTLRWLEGCAEVMI